MASRHQNIIIEQAASFSANVAAYINTSSSETLNVVYGHTANAAIKRTFEHGNVAATFNVWIMPFPNVAYVNIQLNPANTVILNGKYVYDVLVKNSDTGVATRIVEGIATVTPGVAR